MFWLIKSQNIYDEIWLLDQKSFILPGKPFNYSRIAILLEEVAQRVSTNCQLVA